jgi:hypothetical protein
MKRIVCIGIALLLLLAAAGCAPTNPAPTASPIVTAGVPSPEASILPATSPDNAGGTGTGGNAGGTGATIPNFAEGTEVTEADVPEIKTALQEKYEGATIKRITHSLQGTQQGYMVEYTTQDGKTETAYITPGGEFVTATGGANGTSTANPAGQASPGAATSPGTATSPAA